MSTLVLLREYNHIALLLQYNTVLMIMASHRTFSGQVDHLSGQIKFGQTNLLYIINGEVIEFTKENECPDNFQSLS